MNLVVYKSVLFALSHGVADLDHFRAEKHLGPIAGCLFPSKPFTLEFTAEGTILDSPNNASVPSLHDSEDSGFSRIGGHAVTSVTTLLER
jgi:hypothetical protein